jgi:hypothetical protein
VHRNKVLQRRTPERPTDLTAVAKYLGQFLKTFTQMLAFLAEPSETGFLDKIFDD